jgi:hypothetical protein
MEQSRLRYHSLLCSWPLLEHWHPPEPNACDRRLLLGIIFNEATAANPLSFVSGFLRLYGFCRQNIEPTSGFEPLTLSLMSDNSGAAGVCGSPREESIPLIEARLYGGPGQDLFNGEDGDYHVSAYDSEINIVNCGNRFDAVNVEPLDEGTDSESVTYIQFEPKKFCPPNYLQPVRLVLIHSASHLLYEPPCLGSSLRLPADLLSIWVWSPGS